MALANEIGCFAWFSLMTSDTGKATEFYKNLLGWTTEDFEIPDMETTTTFTAAGKGQLLWFGPVVFFQFFRLGDLNAVQNADGLLLDPFDHFLKQLISFFFVND